ncbi:MAG: carboxypeptidase-like regulatory domain-containing protein [Sphingobacteriales bacterium]
MSKPKKDIAQIKKYLQGGLDNHAMHELERRALDDPFLADALEGYEKTGRQQQKNLDELSQRLQNRTDKKVRSIVPWTQLSIAASLLIIIGLGAWLLLRNKTEKTNLVAVTVKTEKQVQPLSAPSLALPVTRDTTPKSEALTSRSAPGNAAAVPPAPESFATNEKPQADVAAAKADTTAYQSKAYSAPIAFNKTPSSNTDQQAQYKSTDKQALNEVVVQDQNKQAGYLSSQTVKKAPLTNPETQLQGHVEGLDIQPAHKTLTGYITSANGGQPLIGAVVKLAGANFGAVTDANGRFVLHDVPEKKNLVVNYLGYNSKQVKLNASDSINVTLEPKGDAVAEVAVSAAAPVKAKSNSLSDAHPSAGWKAFNDYLAKNAVLADGETGKVQLSFMVDGKGAMSDFKVLKSLNTTADQKAIDLITNGPAWAGNIDGEPHEVKVTVKFR